MGGGGTNTTTQTTGTSNPTVTSTLNKLLGSGGGVSGLFDKGPQVFNQSEYAGAGPTTSQAWTDSLNAASNPTYAAGVSGALADQANKAAGNDIGLDDPAYKTLKDSLSSQVMGDVGSAFTNSGRFGGDSYVKAATTGLTNALAPVDIAQLQNGQQQQQQAIQNLPGLFSAAQAPSATAGAVGAAQDANAQGTLSGQADLFNRQQNGQLTLLQQLSGILNGSTPSAGTTTTNTTPATPWWQSALGLGVSLL